MYHGVVGCMLAASDLLVQLRQNGLVVAEFQHPALKCGIKQLSHGTQILSDLIHLFQDPGNEAEIGVVVTRKMEDGYVAGLGPWRSSRPFRCSRRDGFQGIS